MKPQNPIRVTIFDDSTSESCPAHCGMTSSREALEFAMEHLRRGYRDKVEVEYLDLAEPGTRQRYKEVWDRIEAQNLELPLVAIDGRLKLAGRVEYRSIVDAIEAHQETAGGGYGEVL